MNDFEDLVKQNENKNLLVALDNFEKNIKLMDSLKKEYDEIKLKIKNAMLNLAKKNNLDQVKWTTPNNIKITLSVGKAEELEKQKIKEFNVEILKEKYPSIYEDCLVEKEVLVTVKNGSNDRLVITPPKE